VTTFVEAEKPPEKQVNDEANREQSCTVTQNGADVDVALLVNDFGVVAVRAMQF
jgi:hypothetical protein